jgi:Tol biopolymer transport system component
MNRTACAFTVIVLSLVPVASATPTASPSKIVFAVGDYDGSAIWSVNADGTDRQQLTHPPRRGRDDDPTWSPDRSRIAFVRGLFIGTDDRGDWIQHEWLSVMRADGNDLRQLVIHGHDPTWSPDGSRIAFVKGYADDAMVWTIGPDGGSPRELARGENPAWSPDGKQIAFTRYVGGISPGEVFVMKSNGTGRHRLLARNYESQAPEWSPDGRRIAFLGYRDYGLYVVRANGGNVKRLAGAVSSKDTAQPRWSPDGRLLLFERENKARDRDETYIVRDDGSGLRQLAVGTDQPDWSPDGRSVVLMKGGFVHTLSATGGRARLIAKNARDPDW